MLFNKAYYFLKPLIPWSARIAARRIRAARLRKSNRGVWPIDEAAGVAPPGWPGWPNGKKFAFVLTHDVEGLKGLSRVESLAALELRLGFRSSFNLVPEEYDVPAGLIRALDQSGFEIGVHGLEHDGKLYDSKDRFELKAAKINQYITRWNAKGFRSPLMQHRLGWLHRLTAEYDSSTFDTDPFEPEPDGVKTIFPFWVRGPGDAGFVELPYTLAQDFTMFVILKEKNIDIWKKKLDWIAQRGGMAMLITHPDYMCFGKDSIERDETPVSFYEEFLTYVREKYRDSFWAALPRDVNEFYRANVPSAARNTRKRVCILTPTSYQNDNRLRRYAESLAQRGDLVEVIALQSRGQESAHALKGVNVYAMVCDRAGNGNGKWDHAWRLLRFFCYSFAFVGRRHRLINYDVVHVHRWPNFFVFATLYPKWTGSKLILDADDMEPTPFKRTFKSRVRDISRRLVARSLSDENCSAFETRVEPETRYLSLVDSLCTEQFGSTAAESDLRGPLVPKDLRCSTAVHITDKNLPVSRDNDVR